MKKRGKKAISPLIATVLLIGFVVAIGAVVMIWGKGFITERAQKEGALSQAQLDCNLVEIDLEGDYIINVGSITIGGFIIRGNGVSKDYEKLEIMGSRYYSLDHGDEIIPCIQPEGAGAPLVPCSGKAIKLR